MAFLIASKLQAQEQMGCHHSPSLDMHKYKQYPGLILVFEMSCLKIAAVFLNMTTVHIQ